MKIYEYSSKISYLCIGNTEQDLLAIEQVDQEKQTIVSSEGGYRLSLLSFILEILQDIIHSTIRIIDQMGKRSQHRKNKGGSKKVKTQWKVHTIPEEHQFFRKYYELQLGLETADFQQFWAKMKEKLPVVFRVNPNCPNFEAFKSKLDDEDFLKKIIPMEVIEEALAEQKQQKKQQQPEKASKKEQQANYEPKELPKLERLDWYPGQVVYTMNTTKQTFKKSKILSEFHKYLQKAFDSGLVSRQELVSMLPPLYLNIQPDDKVLDMCAAPGSKTSQILQMMYGDNRWLTKGCVVANDADYSRAQMLIHQLHRSGTTGMAVINHPGQFMPQLYTHKVGSVKQKFQFDKILCDVPCSGDGATRKLPIKWASWHTSDGMVLHPLQLSILMKGINLLKRGGYLVYSTCSLNPIQNQSVVNALFDKVNKGLELIDIHPLYGVKGRRGLNKWKVCSISDEKYEKGENNEKLPPKKFLKEYSSFEEVKNFNKIKETMFPPTQKTPNSPDLSYTMRVLPHDQNSGGFYVALIRKLPDFEWKYATGKSSANKSKQQEQAEFVEQNMPECEEVVAKQNGQKQQKQKEESEEQDGQEEEIVEKGEQEQEQEQKVENKEKIYHFSQNTKKNKDEKPSKFQSYQNLDEEEFNLIQKFFGLGDEFRKLLFVRQNANNRKKVLLVSEGVRSFLDADTHHKIKHINMGCVAFEKGKESFAGHQCLYRLCQDGIHFLLGHITERKIKVPLSFFKKAISISSLPHQQIEQEEVRVQVSQMTQGSFCIYIDEQINGKRVIDALVGQNFKNSLHLMVSKQDMASLAIRYL